MRKNLIKKILLSILGFLAIVLLQIFFILDVFHGKPPLYLSLIFPLIYFGYFQLLRYKVFKS